MKLNRPLAIDAPTPASKSEPRPLGSGRVNFRKRSNRGFTLIEVLLALAIIGISLTALLKSTGQDVFYMQRIKNKSIRHWVGLQAISMVQMNLVEVKPNQQLTQATNMFGQRWFWRAQLTATGVPRMQKITIVFSQKQAGPFGDPLIGFKYIR